LGSGGWGWGLGVGGFIFASRAEHQLGLVRIFDGLKASRCMWGGGGARANPKPSTPNPKSKPQPQTLKQGTRQLSRRGSESRKSAKVSFAALATFACFATFSVDDRLREGCRDSRGCSRDPYPESYITKYTSIRRYGFCHCCGFCRVVANVPPGFPLLI